MPHSRPPRLSLESLDERIVPALVNLTTAGSAGAANGALFQQRGANADGDDPTHTFLRIQETSLLGSLLTSEEGYNTNARPLQFDTVGPNVTRALQLREIPVVMIEGVEYREFLLTTNQPGIAANITLDELRIYVNQTSGNQRGYNQNNNRLNGMIAMYDLDAGGNNSVRINDNLNRTDADIRVLIPSDRFGTNEDAYVYLYSSFSAPALSTVLSGAEAWSVREIQDEPAGLVTLSGRIFLDENRNGLLDEGEVGQEGVIVTLFGFDVDNNPVSLTAETDANGFFTFSDPTLIAGTYTITEQPLSGFGSFDSTAGDEGGIDDTPGTIIDITLEAGDNATGYLFGQEFSE